MKSKCLLLFLFLSFSLFAAEEVSKLLGGNHEFFTRSRNTFSSSLAKYFMWTSDAQIEAFYPADPKSEDKLTLFGQPVESALVKFTKDHPSSIYLTLYQYNGKNAIEISTFRNNMKAIFAALKKRYPKIKPKLLRERRSDDLHVNALYWKSGNYACLMKWAIKGSSKPEYLQIEFDLVSAVNDPLRRSIGKTNFSRPVFGKDIRRNVKRRKNGNVFISGVPMVEQGDKGNSAVSTVQRILEYYGIKPEKPIEIPAVKKGTKYSSDVEEPVVQLRGICEKNGLKLTEDFLFFDGGRSARKLENLVGSYNREAKREGEPKIEIPAKGVVVIGTIKKMKPEFFFKVRNIDHNADKFQSDIMRNIVMGRPVIWYTILGVAKEDLPKKVSDTQMRLIIGFNSSTREVIYTDCWGEGHEIKKMPYSQAWPITLGLFSIEPESN